MAIEMPMPEPQTAMPRSASPEATASRQPGAEIGIIDAVGAVGAEVADLVPLLAQPGGKLVLEQRIRHGRRRVQFSSVRQSLAPEPMPRHPGRGRESVRMFAVTGGRQRLRLSEFQGSSTSSTSPLFERLPGGESAAGRQPRGTASSGAKRKSTQWAGESERIGILKARAGRCRTAFCWSERAGMCFTLEPVRPRKSLDRTARLSRWKGRT